MSMEEVYIDGYLRNLDRFARERAALPEDLKFLIKMRVKPGLPGHGIQGKAKLTLKGRSLG